MRTKEITISAESAEYNFVKEKALVGTIESLVETLIKIRPKLSREDLAKVDKALLDAGHSDKI